MSKKIIKLGKEGREALMKGIALLKDSVVSTMGPAGRTVLIDSANGAEPVATKDGVTVAKSIQSNDPVENMGIRVVREASKKTATLAGDGTTTSTLIAATLAEKGLQLMDQGFNAVMVKRGIEDGVRDLIFHVKEQSYDITTEDQLEQIATISANGETKLGALIAHAMDSVNRDGMVSIEESRTGEDALEVVEGVKIDKGHKSPYFANDDKTGLSIYEDALVLVCADKINKNDKALLSLLNYISSENRALLIIADDVEGEALSTLVVNKMQGVIKVAVIKAPGFGDKKLDLLEDIATVVGAKVIHKAAGRKLDMIQRNADEWLGRARKVIVGKNETSIIDGAGESSAIEERAMNLKSLHDLAVSPYEKEQLEDRIARIAGGVAVAHIGGKSEIEIKERKDRAEDALYATKAALDEGFLPGGGIALLRASIELHTAKQSIDPESAYDRGYTAALYAASMPFIQIQMNSGMDKQEAVKLTGVVYDSGADFGYNPLTEEIVNMIESGIIDPTKVTRLALENAASVAGTLMTTECVVANEEPESSSTAGIDLSKMM